jgi:Zn ribbon nucleic-acid-binding protein
LAEYFSNQTLSGSPTVTRCETSINNTWGSGGPGGGVPVDHFSARWTGSFDFAAGDATFTTTADDGIRLWVDNQIVIDNWVDQGATTKTATRTMTAGSHQVKVEYYENSIDAVAKASWAAAGPPPSGCPSGQFLAEYFGNKTLSGTAVLSRCEAAINNDWGSGSPGSGVPNDNFSVRWTGPFNFAAGDATFTTTADDGIRLWVDNQIVIDNWVDQGATTKTATRTMTAGSHQVKVEYYDSCCSAVAKASWTGGATAAARRWTADAPARQAGG